jgi:hypothetical protein
MTQRILGEFLQAIHSAFKGKEYGVIGGAALAMYGNNRGTSDVDVMIPADLSEVVESQLLSSGIVRTAGSGFG